MTSSLQAAKLNDGIFVSGVGLVYIKPDVAKTNIGIEIIAQTVDQATVLANKSMAELIKKIKSLGIDEKDIQTSSYSIYPITNHDYSTEPKITGYRVNNQLNVKIRNLVQTGTILQEVAQAGANHIYGISFDADDPTVPQREALALAVRDAYGKAQAMAQAAGVVLGNAKSIIEEGKYGAPIHSRSLVTMESASVPVESGELKIEVHVQMRFSID